MNKPHGTPMHRRDLGACPACIAAFEAGRGVGKVIGRERKARGETFGAVKHYVLTLPGDTRRAGILAGINDAYNEEV